MSFKAHQLRRMAVAALVTVMVVGALVLALVLATSGRPAGHQGSATPSPRPAASSSGVVTAAPPTTPSASDPTEQAATSEPAPEPSQPTEQAQRPSSPGCDGVPLVAPADPNLAASLAQTAADWGAGFEAAWYDPATGIVQAGGLANQAAWSTSKVPLSVAVVQSGQGDAYAGSISAALQVSDNAAAAALWQALGPDDATRAQAVTGVLRQAGDGATQVPSTQLYPPYSVFGQTQWSTAAQVGFMQQLPCLAGSGPAINAMSQISSAHAWGLGRLPGAVFKGGWGPEPSGGYLVRQLGWYTTDDGSRVMIALAVQAGSFEAGIGVLDAMAAQLG